VCERQPSRNDIHPYPGRFSEPDRPTAADLAPFCLSASGSPNETRESRRELAR
jgi:hypothetical protein